MATCPECNGSNVKKCSLIYAQESRSSVSSGGGVAVGFDGSIGVLSGTTAGRSVSDLGKRVAPPRSPARPTPNGWLLLLMLAGIGTAIGFICYYKDSAYQEDRSKAWELPALFLLATAAIGWLTVSRYLKARAAMPALRAAHAKAMREWESKWMCLSCGKKFKLEQDRRSAV